MHAAALPCVLLPLRAAARRHRAAVRPRPARRQRPDLAAGRHGGPGGRGLKAASVQHAP